MNLFRHILPEADVLDLHILMMDKKRTAVMTVLIDHKAEDRFSLMREIPQINSYTYMVAWLLQGHFYYRKEKTSTPRQKRHKLLLDRYFDGKLIRGSDTFQLEEIIELYYEPPVPKVPGVSFLKTEVDPVLYSGYPKTTGFAKIILPGFKLKYIAVFPEPFKTYFFKPISQ